MTSAARHRAPPGLLPGALSALADLVLPRSCGGCGAGGVAWCGSCADALADEPTSRLLDGGLVVWSAARYEDPVRSAVVRWKDRGRPDLARPLAVGLRRAAATALRELPPVQAHALPAHAVPAPASPAPASPAPASPAPASPAPGPPAHAPPALVPVPSSRHSTRVRGHDPVRDLARAAASGLRRRGLDVVVLPVLRQRGRVADQAGLTAEERRRNLDDALAVAAGWRPRLAGRDVLLVDDVVTTGATLGEALRVLDAAGARVVGAATVAATPRRGHHSK